MLIALAWRIETERFAKLKKVGHADNKQHCWQLHDMATRFIDESDNKHCFTKLPQDANITVYLNEKQNK